MRVEWLEVSGSVFEWLEVSDSVCGVVGGV